jgi:vacuolar-type H+-ATPase subunit H
VHDGKGAPAAAQAPAPEGKEPYRSSSEHVDVFRLLDQLEGLPEKAKHLPLNTLVGFDHEQFYYLVLKIRANLPEDMKVAERVRRDHVRILDDARASAADELAKASDDAARAVAAAQGEAERLVAAAREQADRVLVDARDEALRLVSETEVYRMAEASAQEMVSKAQTEADETRDGADQYVRDVLGFLEGQADKVRDAVQDARYELDRRRGGAA